jgi:hypothetical protein
VIVELYTDVDQEFHERIEARDYPLRCADEEERKLLVLKQGVRVGDQTWRHLIRYESEYDA